MVGRRSLRVAAFMVGSAVLCGCTTIQQMMPSKREAQERARQIQDLQLSVMRFADEYAGRVREAINRFQADAQTPEERLSAQNWKVQQADAAYTIASGPNPVSNALDLVVLASLSRMVVDDAWGADLYGSRAQSVRETHRLLEAGAWQLLSGQLTDAQTTRLREIIARWRVEHPNVRAVAYIHFRDFAKSVGAPRAGEQQTSGSLFSVLGLDPLRQLDPAVREITQTRELAERAIYYMQRAPGLLDMQIERLTYQLAAMPETKLLLSDVDRVSLIGKASDRLVQTLPELLDREREALFSQVMRELNDGGETVRSTAGELRATLEAGTATATALHATLDSVDRITGRFAPKAGSSGPEEKRPPFDIREYTEMAREVTVTIRELQTLAQRANSVFPALHSATEDAASSVERVLNHLFLLLALLVVTTAAATLLAALAYRRVTARLPRR